MAICKEAIVKLKERVAKEGFIAIDNWVMVTYIDLEVLRDLRRCTGLTEEEIDVIENKHLAEVKEQLMENFGYCSDL